MKPRIAYLLHRFPRKTDTFIQREILELRDNAIDICVISVWHPSADETSSKIFEAWQENTLFLLPKPLLSVVGEVLSGLATSPGRFLQTLLLACKTARPGVKGGLFQVVYFCQAILAGRELIRNCVSHVHNHIGDQSGTVTMLAARFARIDYSITYHGWPVFYDGIASRIKQKVNGARFSRAISYFCCSQLMLFSGREDSGTIPVIHCGLDLSRYEFREPKRDARQIFCAARLTPEKGLDFLLYALARLRLKGHDLILKLAGDGPHGKRLQQIADNLGIADHVCFLGHIDEDAVRAELTAADFFVLPSFVEGLPVSAMEAMAIGTSVIATNIAGTSELVVPFETGLLIRPADEQAIVAAVETLLTNYDLRKDLARTGRKKVEAEFDIKRECQKLKALFTEQDPFSCNPTAPK